MTELSLPVTRWARTRDGADIAYQSFGSGPVTLAVVHGWISHLEVYWEQPRYARFMRRLAVGMRVVVFDKRGVGMSDRLSEDVDLETRMDDVAAVLDAAGVDRAAVFGWGSGGPAMAAYFAATHPERTVALLIDPGILEQVTPGWVGGETREEFEASLAHDLTHWDDVVLRGGFDSPPTDADFAAWCAKFGRYAVTPASYERFSRALFDTDITGILPAIRVPTLVLATQNEAWWSSEASARAVAERISGARVAVTERRETVVWVDEPDDYVAVIEDFLGLEPPVPAGDRVLLTVLFTDIVGSTATLAAVGDARWTALLADHDARARAQIARFAGTLVDTAGDGLFATFTGPARAVRCAEALVQAAQGLGLEVRAGVHTGEVELDGDRVRGIAVHIGARVMSCAGPAEVLVTATVRGLVAGSGLRFADAGMHALAGVPDPWELARLLPPDPDAPPS